jgi:hypothetical protein
MERNPSGSKLGGWKVIRSKGQEIILDEYSVMKMGGGKK